MREKALAYHEAGHAVAMTCFGIEIAYCEFHPGEDEHGSTEPAEGATANGRQRLAIAWAGPLAELKVDPFAHVVASDQEAIKAALHDFRGTIVDMIDEVSEAAVAAHELVEREWSYIERVGDALLEHGRLTGDQVYALKQ
jgi:hypothetical protein